MVQSEHPAVLEDHAIIDLYWDRDETAITHTDQKYGTYLASIARNILANPEDIDECLNDTYLKTWNAIPPNVPTILRAFLAKIMRNSAIDRYAEANRQKRVPAKLCTPLSDIEYSLPDNHGLDEILESKQIAAVITAYLSGINDRSLYIFISRYYFLIPIKVIAKKLAVSEATVHKSIRRMKQELTILLKKEGIGL